MKSNLEKTSRATLDACTQPFLRIYGYFLANPKGRLLLALQSLELRFFEPQGSAADRGQTSP